jgi:hypothetical protein
MAKIKVNDIKPIGTELFDDSESFMNELRNDELEQAMGGNACPIPARIVSYYCPPDSTKPRPNTWNRPCTPVIL